MTSLTSIPNEMRAVRLQQWQSEPELVRTIVPIPRGSEVLLRVDAAGLCHSDLHLMEWPAEAVPFSLPFTLGHETAGTVVAAGPAAASVDLGARVIVYSRWGCGRCWACIQGTDNRCETAPATLGTFGGGVGSDGGLADYMLVPSARYLVAIDGLVAERAAPLTDAALTPYHAIKRVLHLLRPGVAVVVIGVGGVGHMAVQLLRALSPARIVAVDRRASALAVAEAAGADAALPAADLTSEQLRREVGSRGAAVVLDCVATDGTLRLAAEVLGVGGELIYLGRGGGSLPVSPASVPFECAVSLPSWGTLPELAEVVALARAGAIDVEVECTELGEAVATYGRLRRGEVQGRAVVVPRPGT